MRNSRFSHQSSSASSAESARQSPNNRHKSPVPANFEYLGRLVTRERPLIQKSKSALQHHVVSHNKPQYHQPRASHHREIYEDVTDTLSDDDDDHDGGGGMDNYDGLGKPVGVIRINDRHLREIYRLPTPPPKVKRVYHRLRSPETKVIERVFVRRPPPQIIENVIEVPPEKVRIINREKLLAKPTPITRSKLIHLKNRHHRQEIPEQEEEEEEEPQQQQQQISVPGGQCPQQETFIPSQHYSQQQPAAATTTSLVYPPQPTMNTVGYIQSSVPPHLMFNSQQPLQISPQQMSTQPTAQPVTYTYVPQPAATPQMSNQQPTTTYTYAPQPTPTPQMANQQPAVTYTYVQPGVHNHQMMTPTSYNYLPQQMNQMRPFGCTRY
ncbi:unnamed protein product [Adineta steineri]|uniref:Uncharacterized protein n=1 Tax=Adineta steineri TaxID=433720 RepID=A0A814ABJ7_9BILA|nr:unnamed protein product [Adineta steineri]CAF1375295.1 unnamed protein product [Adineta steineri]